MRATFWRNALALWLLAAGAAFAQEAAPQPDRYKDAVDRIKGVALGYSATPLVKQADELDAARKVLIDKREETLVPYVIPLRAEGEVVLRINAAIILAGMAKAGMNRDELVAELTHCLEDSNPGVVRWGLDGFLRTLPAGAPEPDKITLANRVAALRKCLDRSRPRALRTAAVMVLDERKPQYAIPILVAHLQALLPEYEAELAQRMSVEEAPLATDAGGPGMAPPPGGPGVPGAARASRPRIRRPINPAMLNDTEQSALAAKVEAAPAVTELHFAGLVLESIIVKEYKAEKFDANDPHFDNQPPWELKKSVEWLVNAWMPKHAGDFKDIPAPEPPAPETAKPAAATAPAPARTAAPTPAAATTTTVPAKPAAPAAPATPAK